MWLLPHVMSLRCRAEPHPDPGIPGDSPDPANQHHGTEQAAVLTEPRREVRDLDATAVTVMQAGHQDRRVDEVGLLVFHDIDQVHGEKAEVRIARSLAQQGAKHRVAVEAWEAGPHDLAQGTHQRADRPVPDQGEVERRHGTCSSGRCASHARTASTSRSRQCATVRPGPTFTEWPCSRLTVAKPCSSVVSSPMNTGVLPQNGSSCMNSSTATPLSLPAGFISTMRLPVCTQYWLPIRAASERISRCA